MKRILIAAVFLTLTAGAGFGGVPRVLNHHGILTDEAGSPLTGDYYMAFRLFDQPTEGTELWGEIQRVTVTDGTFNVYLGVAEDLDPSLFTGQEVYLGVTVADDSEMTPRIRLGSVLYAFSAQNQSAPDPIWYVDSDGDGWGDPNISLASPSQPPGYVANSGDCDDSNSSINPTAQEFCDGLDNDCNLTVDDGIICDDGNYCTEDICSGISGCTHIPLVASACNDGNPCTVNDQCDGAGNCYGTPLDCDDGLACTTDYCDAGQCMHIPNNDLCDDGIPCTIDICDGINGCETQVEPMYCFIDGECYYSGDSIPGNVCSYCDPQVDQYNWTWRPEDFVCNPGPPASYCVNGECPNTPRPPPGDGR